MTLPGFGHRRQTGRAGRYPLLWKARDALSIDALSGQTGTLTQAATVSVTDSFGATVSVNHTQPPWSYVSGQAVTGLRLDTATKTLKWTSNILPQAMCWMVDFVENGGLGTVSGGVAYLGVDAATGARIYIDSTGTQYRATYTDGTTTRTATMTGAAPTSGQRVRLRLILSSTGTIQIGQSINGGAETLPAASAATTLPATWGGTVFRLNAVGTANYGANIYLGVVVMWGSQTTTVLQAALT